jgi:cell division protein ZapA
VGQVNVTINGKHYRMACDDGEEPHLAGLAERLNASIETLRERFGEIGDQRLTVMAAITFADHAAEAARQIAQLEQQIAESEQARTVASASEAKEQTRVAAAILSVAERIESLAGRVGGGIATGAVVGKANGGG